MSYQKKKSIIYQVKERINAMDAMGESKYAAKMESLRSGSAPGGHIDYGDKIYSYRTKEAYLDRCCRFAKWARSEHSCQTLEEARKYADEYLTQRIDSGLSAFSVKLDRAALAKLYSQHAQDFRSLPVRHRANIKRGRTETRNSAEFAQNKHPELMDFVRATGLRRAELEKLRVGDIKDNGTTVTVDVFGGKGGKDRTVTADSNYYDMIRQIIDGAATDERICNLFDCDRNAPNKNEECEAGCEQKKQRHIPKRCPMHALRREYAQAMYARIARDVTTLPEKELYRCRADMHGEVYDRAALLAVSQQLGHSRINVIAEHYMR